MTMFTYAIQILSSLMMLSMVFVMITISMSSANRIVEILDETDPLTILMSFSGDPIADLQPLLDLFKQLDIDFDKVDKQLAKRKAKLGEIQDCETGTERYENEVEAIDDCIALLGGEAQV